MGSHGQGGRHNTISEGEGGRGVDSYRVSTSPPGPSPGYPEEGRQEGREIKGKRLVSHAVTLLRRVGGSKAL